jgi:adenylosuccinate lyase
LTTVGKRAALWIQDFMTALEAVDHVLYDVLKLRGCKGTTGTQESFMKLFDGDHAKVKELDEIVAKQMGWQRGTFPITGQTYPRMLDVQVMDALKYVGIAAYKFAQDMRMLQSFKELEEPFEKSQVGSSAMAYKRNPMRSERVDSLARMVVTAYNQVAGENATAQWFERTLDDSAAKRIFVPDAFMALDEVLKICANVASGIVVNKAVIAKRVREELPFMATEEILMKAVLNGGDRQELHELIRQHSMEAGRRVKEDGADNDLCERIAKDPSFGLSIEEIESALNPRNLCGRAPEQVDEYLEEFVWPIIEAAKKEEIFINLDIEVKI